MCESESLCIKFTITIIILIYLNIIRRHTIELYEKKHVKVMRKTAAECTLFLNKNDQFPIKKPGKVLLIGSGARNTVRGGLGSGNVESRYYITCEEGLERAGFKITSKEWLDKYPLLKETKIMEHINFINDTHVKNNVTSSYRMIAYPEYDYNLAITEEEENADIAIYVIARNSGEGTDRRLIKGDAMLTDTEVKDILYLNKKFEKFMLVLNVGGVVDLSPVKEVSNILLLSQLGVVTGDILADIILGKVNPSGKLATTWSEIKDYYFINEFGDGNITLYKEGVYVGYRYFDSSNVKPLYPFGYGLSYTLFEISKMWLKNIKDEIIIKLKVKNIGSFKGKEVVQVYISPSQENKDKPYQSLIAFKKTPLIQHSKEIEMIINFKFSNIARYDEDMACYVLDKGKYIIRVGNSSRNTKIFGYIELKEDILTRQLKNIDGKPGFVDYIANITLNDDLSEIQKIEIKKEDIDFKRIDYDYDYEFKIHKKVIKLNDTELAYLCAGGFVENSKEFNEKQKGYIGLTTKRVKRIKKYLKMADGPTGIRIARVYNLDSTGYHRLVESPSVTYNFKYIVQRLNSSNISLVKNETKEDFSNYTNVRYQFTTAIPIATACAQSFNVELEEEYGKIIGKEMEIYDVNLWLAPAMNIHRNILCGRNFEYFSEDPLVTGKMAAAVIKGVQSEKHRGTTVKHFAGNNQEYNRLNSDSKISERALREIYLKGFQIAVEEAHPTALMTSYNLINGIHPSENSQLLIDTVRCEWGFEGLIMTDWIYSGQIEYKTSIAPPQFINGTIKAGNNIMMPGSKKDIKLIIQKLNEKELSREDLLKCASKVYETIELLNK